MDRRVLVVDDDPGIQLLLTFGLHDEGYEVRTASDGTDGLAALEAWHPDLVLLDLMMPRANGWDFRAQQLARPDLAAIPVIVLTAGDFPRQDTDPLQPAAIVPKPFHLGRLLGLVATHFWTETLDQVRLGHLFDTRRDHHDNGNAFLGVLWGVVLVAPFWTLVYLPLGAG